MKKKDYELIAFCVRNGKDKEEIARLLTAELLGTNPKFDPEKFLSACGIETDERMPISQSYIDNAPKRN